MRDRGQQLDEEQARAMLTEPNAALRRFRAFWRSLPGTPRCKTCTAPLGGPAGTMLRLIGKGPWPANPRYCRWCFKDLYTKRAGAEIDCTLLFADVRGSTQLAESMTPGEYRGVIDRFYQTALDVLIAHEAIVDNFVGDEVVAIFVPALTGGLHAQQAIDAGLQLLRRTGHAEAPWIPIGVGVNTGRAFVGAVGSEDHVEFTALGDAVNVAARLASAAATGELLAADLTARAAELDVSGLEHRRL